jgi:glycine/D-amino acid oxidase-like deaminating enzyme
LKTGFDTIIVGGGLVGAAVACGVAARGRSVAVLDGEDGDFRASRGNFGLTWIQGKGAHHVPYARLNNLAATQWSAFERELYDATGVDIGFHQHGGLDFCLSEEEWDARESEMRLVSQHTGGAFEYRMLEHDQLRKKVPQISNAVIGASFSPQDGHLNPLYLLRALHHRMISLGCAYLPKNRVDSIRPESGAFNLKTSSSSFEASRVVLCGGLDNARLAQHLDMRIPVNPVRGQLLITERVKPFLNYPGLQVRQTDEGTLQIGDSHEDVGFDESTTLDVIARLSRRAVRIFPHLERVRLVRAWGALRIMTPDGFPIYHRSPHYPAAFAVSCHSGVTLAVLHSGLVADWICGDEPHPLIPEFSADRFNV